MYLRIVLELMYKKNSTRVCVLENVFSYVYLKIRTRVDVRKLENTPNYMFMETCSRKFVIDT